MFLSPVAFNTSNITFKHTTPSRASSDTNIKLKDQPSVDTFERTTKKEIQNIPSLQRGQILNANGEIFSRRTTSMFRDDMEWKDFGAYLKDRFQNANKVNTYVYACAAGAEAYTMSITLHNALKNKAKNFFPIVAKDINKDLIEMNIALQAHETKHTDSYITVRQALDLDADQIQEFVILDEDFGTIGFGEFTNKVTDPVEFSVANILEDTDNIDTKNPSIVMCRNMWPYVDCKEYDTFAKTLYERLAPGSIVVIGEYDYFGEPDIENSNTFYKSLLNAGFKYIKNPKYTFWHGASLIFEKN